MLTVTLMGCSRSPSGPTKLNFSSREIRVTIKSEYTPDRVVVTKGQPVKLIFYRDDDSECTAQVVLEDFKVKKDLSIRKDTVVDLIPDKAGEFTFACGMGMMKGKLVVEK